MLVHHPLQDDVRYGRPPSPRRDTTKNSAHRVSYGELGAEVGKK